VFRSCTTTAGAAILIALIAAPGSRAADTFAQEVLATPSNPSGPPQDFVDLDALVANPERRSESPFVVEPWNWQTLPKGLVYENYLAGTKESRMAWNFNNVQGDGDLFDATVGARVGLFRYGDDHPVRPEGIQVDAEGSAQLRLDPEENVDLRSADFRGGLPISFGRGGSRWKFGYYHISAHAGDEFLLKNPAFQRVNFSRDVLILGHAVYFTPRTRIYAEAGWAFYSDISEPWEFQFGIDHVPVEATGPWGAPFWAVNGHLREELDYGGSLTAQAGWAWRSDTSSPLLRAGVQYFNGKSNQYAFYNEHEEQLGMAFWYDF
jgi:hypothetical protein